MSDIHSLMVGVAWGHLIIYKIFKALVLHAGDSCTFCLLSYLFLSSLFIPVDFYCIRGCTNNMHVQITQNLKVTRTIA